MKIFAGILVEGGPADGSLSEDDRRIAQKRLASLAASVRPISAETRRPSMPRLRRLGRRLAAEAEGYRVAAERLGHASRSPHYALGRFKIRLRLRLRGLRQPQLLVPLLLLIPLLVLRLVVQPAEGSTLAVFSSVFFGVVAIGAVAAAWKGLVRWPLEAWKIRRRIIRQPQVVLPTTSPTRQAELAARDEEVPIVPRQELYDDVLPGIVDPRRSDIQMLVGEPGAGKTTALVDLSERLARTGIVPVVLPIWREMPEDLVHAAEERFKQHARGLIGSSSRLEDLWHWLRQQGRLVIAIDDVDRIAPDGERGFMLRRALDDLAGADLPAVVTTRPAGIPAGLAAAAVDLENLDREAAVSHVLRVARAEPGSIAKAAPAVEQRGKVAQWVREGGFEEVPFYLELLARLVAVGRCEELAPARPFRKERRYQGRVREREGGQCEWNPLWVRFLLLERYYDEVVAGRVHRWLAIETDERRSCLEALSGAALATLAATALDARAGSGRRGDSKPGGAVRRKIEDFLESDDRASFDDERRSAVSAHEVVDAGERLRILDRDPGGELHFHHRIMQAYLAARCLVRRDDEIRGRRESDEDWVDAEPLDWIGALLDQRFPDRLTAHMTLTFTALCASKGAEGPPPAAVKGIVDRMVLQAIEMLPDSTVEPDSDAERLDPRKPYHPEGGRKDPDDALGKLTTAAEIVRVAGFDADEGEGDGSHRQDIGALRGELPKRPRKTIVESVRGARGATLWTKLHAIPSIAALDTPKSWVCLWEFASDPDQEVRRAASEAIEADAFVAYGALRLQIDELLERAALRSERSGSLEGPEPRQGGPDGDAVEAQHGAEGYESHLWNPTVHPASLRALGWILPAIVSGLRENVAGLEVRAEYVRDAREALEQFVKLAFQGDYPELEASLAQGFKRDAMYHAADPARSGGPGLVANNRRLVTDICIEQASYWYARLVLHQAVALYTVAGSDRQVAFDTFGRFLRGGREPHPFVWRTARLARRAVMRQMTRSERWRSLIWVDEGVAVSRRPAEMNRDAAQLVADVTLLLNLREGAPEDRQAFFPHMKDLPYCLRGSPDRREILGAGCPAGCRYGLCPLRQPPPDEPNGQRTVSRAFCRSQYEIADRSKPPWQRSVHKRVLRGFWQEMERRART